MTPQEIAMKMMSACNTCQGTKCLYRTQCKGTSQTCPLKEVAMTLRGQEARIESLQAELDAEKEIAAAQDEEIQKLKKVNKDYYNLVKAFWEGYKPPKVTKKGQPRRGRPMKRPKDPVEMDGDERFAAENSTEAYPPIVLI